MRTKSLIIIILGILLLQPLLLGASTPITTALEGAERNSNTLAQVPGARLEPEEFADHVPINIDGTADFISQSWPGAGTSGDPYLIEGLNITNNVGLIGIEIINTTASFVIRDCLINQKGGRAAIRLENTTAGTIEYSTIVDSTSGSSPESGAIRLENANNTIVTHIHSTGNDDMGFYATSSYHLTLTGSLLNVTEHRAARVDDSDYLTIDECQFYQYSTGGYWCTRWDNVNHTVITNSEFYSDGGVSGTSFNEAYYSSISDCYIWGSYQDGLNVDLSPNITITRVTIEDCDGDGAAFDDSPGFVFTDSTISDTLQDGLDIDTSPNFTISNINITTAGFIGLRIDASANISVTDIMTDETGSHGLYGQYSDFMTFDDITVTNALDTGIEFQFCNNGSLTNSVVQMTLDAGIYLWTCPNWTVTDNLVEYAGGNGIHLHHGDNYLLTRNYVNYIEGEGINVDTSDNSKVIDNHVTMADSEGYVVTTCENMTFAGNTADECWDGGSFDTSDNMVLEGNSFTNLIGRGMYINDMEDAIIRNNVLSGAGSIGMDIDWLLTSTIEDNDLTGFGFWFYPTRSYSYYNHTVVNNTVNGLDLYYALDPVGVDLTASDYGQFIVINGSHIDIHDGSFDHATNPIMFILSDNCSVWEVDTAYNYYGIYYDRTDDGNVYNVSIDAGGMGYGIRVRLANSFSLADSAISGCTTNPRSGVLVEGSNDISVNDCEFSSNWGGINAGDNTDILISDNIFSDNVWYGISVHGSSTDYVRVLNNEVYNSTYGIWHENADNVTISMNTVMYTTAWAIEVTGGSAQDVNITLNEVTMNDDAIGVFGVTNGFVMNNTVLWNTGYGVYADANVEVYYNLLALNDDNGDDDTAGVFWDDGVDTGNWWDDYTPPGVYAVDGNTDDRYPMQFLPTEPIISQPQDIYYAEGSEGNEISWYAFDDALGSWATTIDGGAWASDAWNFDSITINIDGLEYGTHIVKVTVWDVDGNNITDSVTVHVFDDTPPVISNVPNTEAFVDGTGQTLSWTASDLHPDTYILYADGEEFATGSWTSGELTVNIDGLDEGVRNLLMVVSDIDGNSANDPVDVLVIADGETPTIDSPTDITYDEGSTGNVIVWTPSDSYPESFEITSNGSVVISGSWGGSRIALNVDGLQPGTHNFELTVTDGSGHDISDIVRVVVLAIVGETTPPPPVDLGPILIIAGLAGAVVIVIVVIYFLKKKGSA